MAEAFRRQLAPPHFQHALRYIHTRHVGIGGSRAQRFDCKIGCAGGNIKNARRTQFFQLIHRLAPPIDVGAGTEKVVEEIVPARDGVKHLGYLRFLIGGIVFIRYYGHERAQRTVMKRENCLSPTPNGAGLLVEFATKGVTGTLGLHKKAGRTICPARSPIYKTSITIRLWS